MKDTNTEPNLYKLAEVLNSKYDKDIWNQITKKNNIFKLSNKVKINKDGT
ncbi:capsular polysaccharide synthesis protein, partial [Lactobacillus helveticus]